MVLGFFFQEKIFQERIWWCCNKYSSCANKTREKKKSFSCQFVEKLVKNSTLFANFYSKLKSNHSDSYNFSSFLRSSSSVTYNLHFSGRFAVSFLSWVFSQEENKIHFDFSAPVPKISLCFYITFVFVSFHFESGKKLKKIKSHQSSVSVLCKWWRRRFKAVHREWAN